ncbi:hypothetical protein [Nocardioides sp. R-C-SC26]|uniref:hypothetical protein n=1 Tax=Nocardioides sp. R-C-SC26 TaxID=2870414 RepID=UPI001E4172ED|nr:hypothetical protein [Nocardioides sp. R-C-SC26]
MATTHDGGERLAEGTTDPDDAGTEHDGQLSTGDEHTPGEPISPGDAVAGAPGEVEPGASTRPAQERRPDEGPAGPDGIPDHDEAPSRP